MAYLVQRLVVDARAENRDRHGSTLRLQRVRAAVQQRCPISTRDEIHLVNEEKHGRLGQILLQYVDVIAAVRSVPVVRADLKTVDEHAEVREDRRALGGQVRVNERVLVAAVLEVEDERPGSARGSARRRRSRRGGIVRAMVYSPSASNERVSERDVQDKRSHCQLRSCRYPTHPLG